jgi:SAM-dependent methyltransferase
MATVTPMANEAMKQNWAGGGERWAVNERLIDSSFTMVTEAIVAAADLGGATRVLDIGCGTGTLLETVVAAGAEAVGVDISPAMVEAASRRVPDATGVVADAQTDDQLALAFENIRAATAPGGELAFASWRAGSSDIFTAGLGPLAARMDTPLDVPKVGEPGPLGLATSEMIGDTLALAGWTNVIEVALDVTLDYSIDGSDGVEERLAMALSGVLGRTAQAELEPELGPDGWTALLDEARAELRTFIVDGSVRFPGHVWLVTATNPNDVDDI